MSKSSMSFSPKIFGWIILIRQSIKFFNKRSSGDPLGSGFDSLGLVLLEECRIAFVVKSNGLGNYTRELSLSSLACLSICRKFLKPSWA